MGRDLFSKESATVPGDTNQPSRWDSGEGAGAVLMTFLQ